MMFRENKKILLNVKYSSLGNACNSYYILRSNWASVFGCASLLTLKCTAIICRSRNVHPSRDKNSSDLHNLMGSQICMNNIDDQL